MKTRYFAAAIAALLSTAVTSVPAKAGEPVGYVEKKRGAAGQEVWIMRDGRKIRVSAGTILEAGDVVKVSGKENYVDLRLADKKGAVRVPSGKKFTVVQPAKQDWRTRLGSMLDNVGLALGITDRVTSGRAYTRSGTADTGETQTAMPLSHVSLLDTPTLYASRDLDALALRWCGDALAVHAMSDGQQIRRVIENNAGFGAVDLADYYDVEDGQEYLADTVTIVSAVGDELQFSLEWMELADVPRPDELTDLTALTPADKAEWASWLIDDPDGSAGNAYNLIAFSLLAEARDDLWLAGYALERASYCSSESES